MVGLKCSPAVLVCVHLQAIGVRLNELCHAESESPANLLGLIYDEETKRRLRKEDEEEDFLDDSKETPFTTRTPACKNLCFRSTYYFFLFSFSCHPAVFPSPSLSPQLPPLFFLCLGVECDRCNSTERLGWEREGETRL